jgi:hypothetical protein
MLVTCYLRNGIVYIPTVAKRKSEPIYSNVDPVAVVPLSNPEDVRRALLEAIARKNAVIPDRDARTLREPPVLPKYAGVKSLTAFARGTSTWSIIEEEGVYKILPYRKHAKGYWTADLEQQVEFPSGSTANDVVDRMIRYLGDTKQQ